MAGQPLKGHLDGMLLAVLEHEPMHGYRIIEALRISSGGAFDLPTGTIYPALRRLEKAGLVESVWSTDAGRPRRTYDLTKPGRAALAQSREHWRAFSVAVSGVLRPAT